MHYSKHYQNKIKIIFTVGAVAESEAIRQSGQEQLDPKAEDKGKGKGNKK